MQGGAVGSASACFNSSKGACSGLALVQNSIASTPTPLWPHLPVVATRGQALAVGPQCHGAHRMQLPAWLFCRLRISEGCCRGQHCGFLLLSAAAVSACCVSAAVGQVTILHSLPAGQQRHLSFCGCELTCAAQRHGRLSRKCCAHVAWAVPCLQAPQQPPHPPTGRRQSFTEPSNEAVATNSACPDALTQAPAWPRSTQSLRKV